MKILSFKTPLLAILCILCLSLITTETVCASSPNPPAGDSHVAGPAVTGQATFVPSDPEDLDSVVLFEFEGQCQGQEVVILQRECGPGDIYSQVTEESLRDFIIECVLPAEVFCAPDSALSMIIRVVRNFTENEDPNDPFKQANVVVLFIVPR